MVKKITNNSSNCNSNKNTITNTHIHNIIDNKKKMIINDTDNNKKSNNKTTLITINHFLQKQFVLLLKSLPLDIYILLSKSAKKYHYANVLTYKKTDHLLYQAYSCSRDPQATNPLQRERQIMTVIVYKTITLAKDHNHTNDTDIYLGFAFKKTSHTLIFLTFSLHLVAPCSPVPVPSPIFSAPSSPSLPHAWIS